MSKPIKKIHDAGVIDKRRILEREAAYRVAQTPKYTGKQIKEIRTRLHLSQSLLAAIIKTTESSVRAWEEGKRKPRAPVYLILDLLNRKGLEALL